MNRRPPINLASARSELRKINADLLHNCGPDYKLKMLQYRYRDIEAAVYDTTSAADEYDILLCLYHGNKCVSSVTGRYNKTNRSMELLSKTAPEYEGMKFNLYLRSVFIYLMCFVRPTIERIVSHSMNPVSTYAMYKHYNASNPDLQQYAADHQLTPETITLVDAKNFHEYFMEKHKHTRESALKELEDMLQDYSMEELGWETEEDAIEFIMSTMNDKAITLELQLDTPGVKEFLLNKISNTQIKCDNPTVSPRGKTRRESVSTSAKTMKRQRRSKSLSKSPNA